MKETMSPYSDRDRWNALSGRPGDGQRRAVRATEIGNFGKGMWYLNILTPADAMGAIRGQITQNN